MRVCPTTGSQTFTNHHNANRAARAQARRNHHTRPPHIYRCGACAGWHIGYERRPRRMRRAA